MRTRSLLLSSSVVALTAGLLFACGDKDDDTGSDGTTDTDTDTDTTGTDTDTDTDTTGPVDADGDGFDDTVDCDDGDATIHPDATEVCDDVDNDCDDLVDDDDDSLDTSTASTWYGDSDDDGHGDAATSTVACTQPEGYAGTDDDCDDSVGTVYPGAAEECDDGIDQDCDAVYDCDDDSCGGNAACVATIDSVDPSVGTVGSDVALTITGSGFAFGTAGVTTATVGDDDCADVVVVDDSTITCNLPGAEEGGSVDVVVSNDNGDATLAGGFTWQECIYGAQGAKAVAGNLYCINPETGTVTEIGPIGYAVTGLAAGPDGILYATEAAQRGDAHLLTIDPTTGAGTAVGLLYDSVSTEVIHGSIPDIAFAGSTLVGWSEESINSSYDDMVTIDTTTGVVTQFSSTSPSSANTGMASTPDGTVFLMPGGMFDGSYVYTLDVATGVATALGPVSVSDLETGGRASGAYFGGKLYAMGCLTNTESNDCSLIEIDTSTGVGTILDLDMPTGLESITAFFD
ncbi:MAG: IPT/TIG domain-containing protein [Alphaproteobacteria bacterium]|nr:IPT/TIG domain-containing protein [Alphaproteobacteria bacterium]